MSQFKHDVHAARKLWVDALRSGEFKQCRGAMRKDGGHCCLDVARIVMERAEGVDHSLDSLDSTLSSFPDVRDWLGMRTPHGTWVNDYDWYAGCLTESNDTHLKSFEQIASIIESAPPGLFVESKA